MADDSQKKPKDSSRRNFLKIGAGVLAGAAVASVVPISLASAQPSTSSSLQSELSSANSRVSVLQSQLSSASSRVATLEGRVTSLQSQSVDLQTELDTVTGFIILNPEEQVLVEALAETMIPSDSNGPGAKEAGAAYFIDHELAGVYGFNVKNYMQGPFVQPNVKEPITVQGITYSEGTPVFGLDSGFYYQHPFQFREFWRNGLQFLEAYSTQAYGGNFETLTAAQQVQVIADLWANKPTNFTSPTPIEFISEVQDMVWAGFITDPIHGGNQNMVGWSYVGFNGTNNGDFYGEGYTTMQLMVASTPTRLQPASIGQLEKGSA